MSCLHTASVVKIATKNRMIERGALTDFPESAKLAEGSAKDLMG